MLLRHEMPTGEAAIVDLFRLLSTATSVAVEDRIPFDQGLDTVVYEYAFKLGRADVIIFHVDGSASIIEVKDGGVGYMHVARGIGQVGLYAAQLAALRTGLTKSRRCLLWTSTGRIEDDVLIEVACQQAGVVALPWGPMSEHLPGLQRIYAAKGAA